MSHMILMARHSSFTFSLSTLWQTDHFGIHYKFVWLYRKQTLFMSLEPSITTLDLLKAECLTDTAGLSCYVWCGLVKVNFSNVVPAGLSNLPLLLLLCFIPMWWLGKISFSTYVCQLVKASPTAHLFVMLL